MTSQRIEEFIRNGQWDHAEAAAREQISETPTVAKPHAYLGLCFYRRDQFAEAEPHFRRAAHLDPQFVDAGVKLAQCLQRMHRYRESLEVAEQFLRLRPNDHTLEGLVEFLRPMVHGERQGWERTMGLERKIVRGGSEST